MKSITSKIILLIIDAFVNHPCWDEWKEYIGIKFYDAFAPTWPNMNASDKELQEPLPIYFALATLTGYTFCILSLDHCCHLAK